MRAAWRIGLFFLYFPPEMIKTSTPKPSVGTPDAGSLPQKPQQREMLELLESSKCCGPNNDYECLTMPLQIEAMPNFCLLCAFPQLDLPLDLLT